MRAPARRPPPLRLRLDAPLVDRLPGTRREIAAWATDLGFGADFVDDLVLAAHEALANVADHAYPGGEGRAWLDLECVEHGVEVVVRDEGAWRAPPAEPGWRGRGLLIIRGLADHTDVRHDAGGTTVRMRWLPR
jgi:serine/threonine-protein kinase RsbW